MASPKTYAEWVIILDKFGKGDDTIFEEMNKGSFALDAGTASRFYKKVDDAYKSRKNIWLTKFQRSFQIHNFKTENDLGIVLREGKSNLIPLLKFVTSKGLPEDLRSTLHKDLEEFVLEIRKSMKENVSKTDNGREKLFVLINSFGLFANPNEIIENIKPHDISKNEISNSGGRKIIF